MRSTSAHSPVPSDHPIVSDHAANGAVPMCTLLTVLVNPWGYTRGVWQFWHSWLMLRWVCSAHCFRDAERGYSRYES